MKVTAKITKNFEDTGKLKAFATVCLADAFLVTGIRGREKRGGRREDKVKKEFRPCYGTQGYLFPLVFRMEAPIR